jgi:hypothetical protein
MLVNGITIEELMYNKLYQPIYNYVGSLYDRKDRHTMDWWNYPLLNEQLGCYRQIKRTSEHAFTNV